MTDNDKATPREIDRLRDANVELVRALQKMVHWLDAQAARDEQRAKDGRFPSLADACAADARNFRVMSKDLMAALSKHATPEHAKKG